MTTYDFPAGNSIAVYSVGDEGPGIDVTLAAGVGVQGQVFADAAGTIPVVTRDYNGLLTILETNADGWFSAFTVEDYSLVYIKFGDLPPQPHFSTQMMRALPQAQAAQLAAEQARTMAEAAAAAAELSRIAAEAAAAGGDAPVDAAVDAGIQRAIAANLLAPSSAVGAADGEVLTWDATVSRFVPEAPPSGGGGIDGPVDVPVIWNGTVWKIGSTTVASVADVQALGYVAGSRLVFVAPGAVQPPAWTPLGDGFYARSGWLRS